MKLWAMERAALIEHLAERHRLETGLDLRAAAEFAKGWNPVKAPLYEVRENGEAHIPIEGVLSNHRSFLDVLFNEAPTRTYDEIIEATWEAEKDPQVKSIVYDVNSNGGESDGLDDAAQAIAQATKPTVAVVRDIAASAAYWIASQAKEIRVTSPYAAVGSIGVIAQMYDFTEYLESQGIKPLLFVSTEAPEKRALWEPATAAGEKAWTKMLDDIHGVFAMRVANGRKTTIKRVNSEYGRGSVLIAADALKAGMIDKISGDVVPGAAKAADTQEEVQAMNLDQLKTEHPDVYRAAVAVGVTEGVQQEKGRVAKLMNWASADPACKDIVAEAIVSGKSAEDVTPQLMAAIKNAPENPPVVATAAVSTASGEQGKEVSDADIKAALAKLPRA